MEPGSELRETAVFGLERAWLGVLRVRAAVHGPAEQLLEATTAEIADLRRPTRPHLRKAAALARFVSLSG